MQGRTVYICASAGAPPLLLYPLVKPRVTYFFYFFVAFLTFREIFSGAALGSKSTYFCYEAVRLPVDPHQLVKEWELTDFQWNITYLSENTPIDDWRGLCTCDGCILWSPAGGAEPDTAWQTYLWILLTYEINLWANTLAPHTSSCLPWCSTMHLL